MRTRVFLRVWAPLAAALLFAAAFLTLHFTMEPRENSAAVADLNATLDMAEARVKAEQEKLSVFSGDADNAAVHKARTVMRFLAHDDTLLQTDALAVLCDLLDCKAVAVVDGEGTVIAASDAALIGIGYGSDPTLSWTMALLDDGAQPMVKAAEGNVRVGGVQRTDIDGYVLVWDEYGALTSAAQAAGFSGAIENLAPAGDTVMLVETAGENGVFLQDGNLYVQRSEGDVTLIAYRPLETVHAAQNAVLSGLGVFAGVTLAAMFLWQILGLRAEREAGSDKWDGAEDDVFPDPDEPYPELTEGTQDAADSDAPAEEEAERPARTHKGKKRRKPLFEFVPVPDVDADDDWPDGDEAEPAEEPLPAISDEPEPAGEAAEPAEASEPDQAEAEQPDEKLQPDAESAPRAAKAPRSLRRKNRAAQDDPDHEAPFDKIYE